MITNKEQRVKKILARISTAEAANTLEEAWALVHDSVKEIEDAETKIPYDWSNYGNSDRMYFPSLGNIFFAEMSNGCKCVDLIAHVVSLFENGCVCIREKRSGSILVSKAGVMVCHFAANRSYTDSPKKSRLTESQVFRVDHVQSYIRHLC